MRDCTSEQLKWKNKTGWPERLSFSVKLGGKLIGTVVTICGQCLKLVVIGICIFFRLWLAEQIRATRTMTHTLTMFLATAESSNADIESLTTAWREASCAAACVTAPCTDSLAVSENHILYKGPRDPWCHPLRQHIQRMVFRRVKQGQRFDFLTMWTGEWVGAGPGSNSVFHEERKSKLKS